MRKNPYQAWDNKDFLVKCIRLEVRKLDERGSEIDMEQAQTAGQMETMKGNTLGSLTYPYEKLFHRKPVWPQWRKQGEAIIQLNSG